MYWFTKCAQAVIPFITLVKNGISSSWTLSIPKLRLGFVQSPIISEQWFWTLLIGHHIGGIMIILSENSQPLWILHDFHIWVECL